MKVILPVNFGKVVLIKDTNGAYRPAIGKSDSDVGKMAEHYFGMHGFTYVIGSAMFGSEIVEFYVMDVQQTIPSTRVSDSQMVEVELSELKRLVFPSNVPINMFLNLGIRLYYDRNPND